MVFQVFSPNYIHRSRNQAQRSAQPYGRMRTNERFAKHKECTRTDRPCNYGNTCTNFSNRYFVLRGGDIKARFNRERRDGCTEIKRNATNSARNKTPLKLAALLSKGQFSMLITKLRRRHCISPRGKRSFPFLSLV